MNVNEAIGKVLKAEGVDILFAYPVNPIIEAAAAEDIRTVIVRQERIGLHMADAYSRLSSGEKIGVFCMQHGPGAENAFGGVAQAFTRSRGQDAALRRCRKPAKSACPKRAPARRRTIGRPE